MCRHHLTIFPENGLLQLASQFDPDHMRSGHDPHHLTVHEIGIHCGKMAHCIEVVMGKPLEYFMALRGRATGSVTHRSNQAIPEHARFIGVTGFVSRPFFGIVPDEIAIRLAF